MPPKLAADTTITTTTAAEVIYITDAGPIPHTTPIIQCLPSNPSISGAWTLALICSVRLPPTQTLFPTVQRIPPSARATFGVNGPVIEPNFVAEAHHLRQTRWSPTEALTSWAHDLPPDSELLDAATLSGAAVTGAASRAGRSLSAHQGVSCDHLKTEVVGTDRTGMPVLPGGPMAANATGSEGIVVTPAGLQAVFSVGREEVTELLSTMPRNLIEGAEIAVHKTRRKLSDRLWKRDADPEHDHQATGRETVLLPPWLTGNAQQMVHTAALASNGSWANWFDGADARTGRIFWTITDPASDDYILRGNVTAIRDPRILAAALQAKPTERVTVHGGSLTNATPLRELADGLEYTVDEEAINRRVAATWIQQNADRITQLLRTGWISDHGWLDPLGLADTLENPFSRTELALPIVRTVALDAWLTALDPEVL